MKNKVMRLLTVGLMIGMTTLCIASHRDEEETFLSMPTLSSVQALEEAVEQGCEAATLVHFYDRLEKEETSLCFLHVQKLFESLSQPINPHWEERAIAYLGLGLMHYKGHYASSDSESYMDDHAKRRADLKRAWDCAKKAHRTFRSTPLTQQRAKRLMISLLCDRDFELETPVTDLDRYAALNRLKSVLEPDEGLYKVCRDERQRLARNVVLCGLKRLKLVAYDYILQDEKSALSLKESVRHRRHRLLQKAVSMNGTCARARPYVESLS